MDESLSVSTEIIRVEQLPVIAEELEKVSETIKSHVKSATSLVCTEETYKTVKEERAKLRKYFEELENQRKAVKSLVMAPYLEIEELYKSCVTIPFKEADAALEKRISEVTESLKSEKRTEAAAYFEEYKASLNIPNDLIAFDMTGIKVDLSVSVKKLKDSCKAILDKIAGELAAIETVEHSEEVFIEYKKSFNFADATKRVADRYREIEFEKKRKEALEKARQAQKESERRVEAAIAEETSAAVEAPVIVDADDDNDTEPQEKHEQPEEKIYHSDFRVWGSIDKLKALKKFLKDGGYRYESI